MKTLKLTLPLKIEINGINNRKVDLKRKNQTSCECQKLTKTKTMHCLLRVTEPYYQFFQ